MKMTEIAEIRERLFQIQGLAYLIGQTRLDEAPPLNLEEINYGVGLSLTKPIEEAMELLNGLEARVRKAGSVINKHEDSAAARR